MNLTHNTIHHWITVLMPYRLSQNLSFLASLRFSDPKKLDTIESTKYQGVKNFTLVARMQKIVALSEGQQTMNLQ